MLQFNDQTYEVLKNWIHSNYGVKSGLHSFEYDLLFDTESPQTVQILAGPCIKIIINYLPNHPQFKQLLRHIFTELPLKKMRRSKALVRKDDAARWYSLSENNPLAQLPKKVNVHSYSMVYITRIKLTDKSTKRSVEVEVTGSVFDAQREAEHLLYGEKLD